MLKDLEDQLKRNFSNLPGIEGVYWQVWKKEVSTNTLQQYLIDVRYVMTHPGVRENILQSISQKERELQEQYPNIDFEFHHHCYLDQYSDRHKMHSNQENEGLVKIN